MKKYQVYVPSGICRLMKKQRNIILYMGTSIDGYFANDDGPLEWLESTEAEGDSGYNSLLERIDTVIMGKGTYDVIRGFDMNYPYSDYKNYVFSKSVSRIRWICLIY